ncbi:MAG: hypothetical protein AAF762_13265, partial [Pseudomonadota bacterium]
MQTRIAVAVLFVALATLLPGGADAQNACEFYRVKKGDTLRDINIRAYGNDNYRPLFRENRREIGRNPNIIEIGQVLRLPCLDGSLPSASSKPQPVVPQTGARITFVTANGYMPYTDESLPEQGLVSHLVRKAMLRGAPSKPVDIVFVNDWGAHLETLLPRQAFDGSFPWTRPGCETQGTLTSTEMYACQSFVYSDPLYEIVEGFFAKAGRGTEKFMSAQALVGSRICRPEGYPTGHLEEMALMPPDVTLVRPTSAYACFEQLVAGGVDYVAIDTRAGARILDDLKLTLDVV